MDSLQLVPNSVALVCQALLAGFAAAYLLTIRRKTRATLWLAGSFGGLALYAMGFLLTEVAPPRSVWPLVFNGVLYWGMTAAVLGLVGFGMTFLARPFGREERPAWWLSVGTLAGLAVWTAALSVQPARPPTAWISLVNAYSVALLVGVGWALVTFGRQAARFRRLAARSPLRARPRRAAARAHLGFGALTLLLLALAVVNGLSRTEVVSLQVLQLVSLTGSLAITFGLFVAYLSVAVAPTTVQAKLVGLGLATVLLVLGIAGQQTLRPGEIARDAGSTVGPAETVRFEPVAGGAVVARRIPLRLYPATGTRIETPEGVRAVELPFAFPFAGSEVRTAYASGCPVVAFRSSALSNSWLAASTPLPRVAAFLGICNPLGATVEVAADAERATFTWRSVEGGATAVSQLTLFPDGAFEVAYRGPEQALASGAVGFITGAGPVSPLPAALPLGAAVRAGPSASLWTDFGARYRAVAHARTAPLIAVVLGSALFVLVMFPLALRALLLVPLGRLAVGVRRLDAGALDTRVRVRANDEVGMLARAFNRMAGSVQSARAELEAYAAVLEDRVAERTAALERSLDELHRAQDRLVQTEKMASLGRLTSGVAHELKNPLNFVTNFAALQTELADELADELGPEAGPATEILTDLRENAAKILEHGQRADGIVRGMALHNQARMSEPSEMDLAPLLVQAADAAEDRARRAWPSVAFVRDLDPALGRAPVAPEAFGQVIGALLDNAAYAVAHGPEGRGTVRLEAHREGSDVIVRVADDGPGMDEATSARAFEPFFTTRPPGEGVGLGLSLAYDIVIRGHGGRLSVETAPGHGAVFTVVLPASTSAESARDHPGDRGESGVV